jgi:hypothetical protein
VKDNTMSRQDAIYIIESGKALDLVKHRIAHSLRIRLEVIALLKSIGCENNKVWTNSQTGVLTCISAKRGSQPEGFTVPDSKGRTWPKKGTELAKRFAEQKGHPLSESNEISSAFNVPLSLEYKLIDGSKGWRRIGYPLSECGYLYLSAKGPYALWIPDIKKAIAECKARGETVIGDAKKFDMQIEGCRRIESEEWEIMVLQHKLQGKSRQAEGGAA